jgi:hypothetical protein
MSYIICMGKSKNVNKHQQPKIFSSLKYMSFDVPELLKRAIKYLVEGLAVAVAAFYIPRKRMDLQEILMIGISAAAAFAVLDALAPSVGASARTGAGLGIGASLVGTVPFLASPSA